MISSPTVAEDVRHALRLVSLGFQREADSILADHVGNSLADDARRNLAGMLPGDARKAFLDLRQGPQ